MNTYICKRDGNALEWRTNPYQPGGTLACWHCEQRLRNGLPLLPERQETPIEELRKMSDDLHAPRQVYPDSPRYVELTQGIEEARKEHRAFNARLTRQRAEQRRCERLKLERRLRGLKPSGWTDKDAQRAHLKRIAAERSRPFWQARAEQLGLGDVA